jgi:hypothetical protein
MRRFAFFERDVQRLPALSCLDVTCAASGGGVVSVGDSEGHVVLLSRDLSLTAFSAHAHRVNALTHIRGTDILITVGDGADSRSGAARASARASALGSRERERREIDAAGAAGADSDLGVALGMPRVTLEGPASALGGAGGLWDAGAELGAQGAGPAPAALLKIWRLDHRDPVTGEPELVRAVRVFDPGSSSAAAKADKAGGGAPLASPESERVVTCIAAADDGTQVAIGCGDGTVILFRGDFTRLTPARGRLFARGFGMGDGGAGHPKAQILCEGANPSESGGGGGGGGGSGGGAAFARGVGTGAITSLNFNVSADPNAGKTGLGASPARSKASNASAASQGMLTLFVTSHLRVRSFFTTNVRPLGMGRGWGPGESFLELDGDDAGVAGAPPSGAAPHRVSLTDAGDLAVARDTGVFFYTPEDRRAAYVVPGAKKALLWFRSYLVLAAEDDRSRAAAAGAFRSSAAASAGAAQQSAAPPIAISIYDLRSKFIAFSFVLPGAGGGVGAGGTSQDPAAAAASAHSPPPGLRFLLSEWGAIFVLCLDSHGATMTVLTEKDSSAKVDSLCQLHLYDLAAAVAAGADGDVGAGDAAAADSEATHRDGKVLPLSDLRADIHKQHGDYLYSRSDYDGAASQYARTIGSVEPSYVIRRFLEPQRAPQLTTYLEALHAAGAALGDHTTLLINCYTTARAQEKLRRFIRAEGGDKAGSGAAAGGSTGAASVNFDVRTAIAVLRDAGCVDEAIWLAERHAEHDLFVALQLSNGDGAAEGLRTAEEGDSAAAAASSSQAAASSASATVAVSYLSGLQFVEAHFYALRYGRALLRAAPAATLGLFISLCTSFKGKPPAAAAGAAEKKAGSNARLRAAPDDFVPLLADSPVYLRQFAEAVVAASSQAGSGVAPPTAALWHALLDVSLRHDSLVEAPPSEEAAPQEASAADRERAREESIMNGILRNPYAAYDAPTALVICSAAGYRAGMVYLYEKLRMFGLALSTIAESAEAARAGGRHAEAKSSRRELVRRAKALSAGGGGAASSGGGIGDAAVTDEAVGEAEADASSIWVTVLRFLAASYLDASGATATVDADGAVKKRTHPGLSGALLSRELDEQDALMSDALKHIDQTGALPPLTVLPLLATCPHLPFGLVRDLLARRLDREAARIGEDVRVAASLQADIDAAQREIARLDSAARTFQARRCRQCGLELDLPSVHFMCGGLLESSVGGGASGGGPAGVGAQGIDTTARGEEHSFHLHCVTDAMSAQLGSADEGGSGGAGALECPICAPLHRQVRNIRASLGVRPGLQEQFFRELKASPDGFQKAAEYMAKGIMDGISED